MKKWLLGILVILLMAGTGTNIYFYLQQSTQLSQMDQRIAGLLDNIDSMQNNISTLQSNLTTMSTNIDDLDNRISVLDDTTSSLNTDINTIENNISIINNSITSTNGTLSSLQTSVNGLQSSVAALQAQEKTVLDVVAKVEPAVVNIYVEGVNFAAGGSGVIIRSNGYILTAYHVISDADFIMVTLASGESIQASVIVGDPNLDIAIIKLNSSRTNFPVAVLGSSASVQVGEEVLAIGYPLSDMLPGSATFTKGIVSAIRTVDNYKYIQTDAALNPGNSGGPLVNMKGEIIGINDWKIPFDYYGNPIDNIAFAIPIDAAKYLIPYL